MILKLLSQQPMYGYVIKQKLLVVLEAEFWYMLFAVAASRGTKVVLLNARISEKSAKKYLQLSWFYQRMLANVEIIYAQSEADKNRFLALGARNIEVIGNIKLAGEIKHTKEYEKPECEVIVAGSTHPGEEESVLKSFIEYKKQMSDAKLIIVPRHPERFRDVWQLMSDYADKNSLSISRFSVTTDFETDLVLIDAMGELNNIYAISDIAILGGAFRDDVGGHNPLEPAHFGCKISRRIYRQTTPHGKLFAGRRIAGRHIFVGTQMILYAHFKTRRMPNGFMKCWANDWRSLVLHWQRRRHG